MKLLKDDNNSKAINFFQQILSILGIRIFFGIIIFLLFCVSFFALFIPSLIELFTENLFSNSEQLITTLIEGITIGLFFGILLNLIYAKLYFSKSIKLFILIDKKLFISNLIVGSVIGLTTLLIIESSGLINIIDFFLFGKAYIFKESPIGQFLSYWNIYEKSMNEHISLSVEYGLLIILVVMMNIIVGVIIGIINGFMLSVSEKIKRFKNNNLILDNEGTDTKVSSIEIIYDFIIPNAIKSIFISVPMGLMYGIIGAIVMGKMI